MRHEGKRIYCTMVSPIPLDRSESDIFAVIYELRAVPCAMSSPDLAQVEEGPYHSTKSECW
jgi:hypothetical protein